MIATWAIGSRASGRWQGAGSGEAGEKLAPFANSHKTSRKGAKAQRKNAKKNVFLAFFLCALAPLREFLPTVSDQLITPAHRFAVAIRHDAMKLSRRVLKHQRQEMPIPFPQRQLQQAFDCDPLKAPLGVAGQRLTMPVVDPKNEAEPILAVLAEARPANGAAQHQRIAFDPGLLANLPANARHHILAGIELASQAVVLAEMRILGPAIAMNEQHL